VKTEMDSKPHPLNTSFAWRSATTSRTIVTDDLARQWDEQGFFVLRDVIPQETIARVRDEIDPLEERMTEWLRKRGGRVAIADADAITFTTHVVKRSEVLRDFAAGEPFRSIVRDLIGPDVRLYWDQAVYKKPEPEREFPWHQDNGYTFIEPQQYVTCWVPLVDATEENGCPQVAPGRHVGGTLAHEWVEPIGFQCIDAPDDAVTVEAAVGDVVVFSSLTPHRTGPNRTDHVRRAYILQYAPDGAVCIAEGERNDEPVPQNDPERQFVVLSGGAPPA
jgi:phytanoyl-CoA hydroxylase